MAFQKFRHSNIKGEKGSDWNIEIWKDGHSGSSTEFDMQGEGFEVTWNGQGGTRNREFIASSCTINMFIQNSVDETFTYDTLNSGFQTYYIRIYRGAVDSNHTNLWWYGWVQPSFDVVENSPFPYVYKLIATDSYGYFNKLKPQFFASEQDKQSDISTITNSLISPLLSTVTNPKLNIGGSTANNLNPAPDNYDFFRSSANWWRNGDTYNVSENVLSKYYVSPGAYAGRTELDEEGNVTNQLDSLEYKLQDVFNGSLRLFNLVGYLAEGKYNFIQPNNLVSFNGNQNITGYINSFKQSGGGGAGSINNFTTALTIDQSNNVILGGSSITFEPPLESVRRKFTQSESSFSVDSGTNIESNAIIPGLVGVNSGLYSFNFNVHNTIKVLKSDFIFSTNCGVFSNTFLTTCDLTIKLTDGSNNYYLQEVTNSDTLVWTQNNSSALSINIKRGYQASSLTNPVNTDLLVPFPGVENSGEFQTIYNSLANYVGGGGGGSFPCKRLPDQTISGNKHSVFRTVLRFNCLVQTPPITGDISIITSTSIDYNERNISGLNTITQVNDPTPVSNKSIVEEIIFTPFEQNNTTSAGSSVVYTANQTTTTAIESLDLGESAIGQTDVNTLYSVKYLDAPLYPPATTGFTRGDSTDFLNILQLGLKEYLDLQTKPLEILQADIQSASISPLSFIKYSINNNSSFKYYSFLGGTFKAQSEIMSGEWFNVQESTTIINNDPTTSAEFGLNPVSNNISSLGSSITKINQLLQNNYNLNVLGILNASLPSNTATTRINIGANVNGKYYSGQKLFLSYPDGSNKLELTCSATNNNVSYVEINSTTPSRDYPINSLILVNTADLTNVITGSGGGGGGNDEIYKDSSSAEPTAISDFTIGGVDYKYIQAGSSFQQYLYGYTSSGVFRSVLSRRTELTFNISTFRFQDSSGNTVNTSTNRLIGATNQVWLSDCEGFNSNFNNVTGNTLSSGTINTENKSVSQTFAGTININTSDINGGTGLVDFRGGVSASDCDIYYPNDTSWSLGKKTLKFSINCNDGTKTATNSAEFGFYNYYYYGVYVDATLTSTYSTSSGAGSIFGLGNNVFAQSSVAFTTTFSTVNDGTGQYFHLAYPTRYGTKSSWTIAANPNDTVLVGTITVVNEYGYSEPYYHYRTENRSIGASNIEIIVT